MGNKLKFEITTSTILKLIAAVIGVWLLFKISDVLVLLFISIVVVVALRPIVDKMSRIMPRGLSVAILLLFFLGIIGAMIYLFIPVVSKELGALSVNLPSIMQRLGPFFQSVQDSTNSLQSGLFNATSQIGKVGSGLYSTTVGFLSGLVGFVTAIVITVYLLLDKNSVERFICHIVPQGKTERVLAVFDKISLKMGSWLRGQIILMIIIGLLDGIALLALGVPYALVLGIWGGLTEVIPYVGPWLGLIPAAVIGLTISPLTGLLVLVAYVIIQQIEAQFLAPKIMSKAVGLSPVVVIIALLIGAKLAGILGVIIAVPAAAAISVIYVEWSEIKKIRNSN